MVENIMKLREVRSVLESFLRNVITKRALYEICPNPDTQFWKTIYGSLSDVVVIEWCKLFGSDRDKNIRLHWKNICNDQNDFRTKMLEYVPTNFEDYRDYHQSILDYRNWMVAHSDEDQYSIAKYPDFSIAIKTACFYYNYIQDEMDKLIPDNHDLSAEEKCEKFRLHAEEMSRKSLGCYKED